MRRRRLSRAGTAVLFLTVSISCLVPPEAEEEIPVVEEVFIATIEDSTYHISPDFDFDLQIARWFDFREAAASLTFDDGTYDQFAHAMPILEEKGVKGTFYLAARLIEEGLWDDRGTMRKMMSWEDAALLASNGHEIGSHSLNHIDLTREGTDLNIELEQSRSLIEGKIPGVTVETFCWPHWRETPEALKTASQYYLSARSGNGVISYYLNRKGGIPADPPQNMFQVNALGLLDSHSREEWSSVMDEVYNRGSWFVSSYHGVDREGADPRHLGWKALPEEMFRQTIDYLKDQGFWIGTFAEVSKYIYERDSSLLHLKNLGDSLTLFLDDGLDDELYNQPLTIKITLPEEWTEGFAYSEDGRQIDSDFSEGQLFLNLIPNGRPVIIKPY